ncbi:MAG: hypothetical protein NC417_11465 [Candidatus Gastranaerophilales bacterium]|nr:hypothetical protein [Candidatus Gastranaerophilales bacterium]
MKKSGIKWLIGVGVLGVLTLIGILKYYSEAQPSPMFTYEFTPCTADQANKKMSIKQVEGLEYSIVPMGEIIISEPSPDWGIMVYFTKDHQNYLYFYGSYSPGGIDPFIYGSKDLNHVDINGKEMIWGTFYGRVIGNYKFTDGYGIAFDLEESLWEDNKKLIFDLIKSAQIDTSRKTSNV